ncbi:MAG: hypothetical protein GY786_23540 [Proteobacteria bacterium]|nr:hypothetical protein [Pseudomonadota bacterium]
MQIICISRGSHGYGSELAEKLSDIIFQEMRKDLGLKDLNVSNYSEEVLNHLNEIYKTMDELIERELSPGE